MDERRKELLEKVKPTPEQERACKPERFGLSDAEYWRRADKRLEQLAKAATHGRLFDELSTQARNSELADRVGANGLPERREVERARRSYQGWSPETKGN